MKYIIYFHMRYNYSWTQYVNKSFEVKKNRNYHFRSRKLAAGNERQILISFVIIIFFKINPKLFQSKFGHSDLRSELTSVLHVHHVC